MYNVSSDILKKYDDRFIWHPFTQHKLERQRKIIKSAKRTSLYDDQGFEIIDCISSWWTCTHGHNHEKLNEALIAQAKEMSHIMFAGFTHPAGACFANELVKVLPDGLSRVFFSDNGSTAVEVALKIALQYWSNKKEKKRNKFIAFQGGYHGDTVGAMSLGSGSGFFVSFSDICFKPFLISYPSTWIGDDMIDVKERAAIKELKECIYKNQGKIAALIIEPLLQGAGGMRVCRPEFLREVDAILKENQILSIYDEVAVGFGRLGSMFGCIKASILPDIICLGKCITAGYMPLAATVTTDRIFEAFLCDTFNGALAHGHSFSGNPLAAAVGMKSLELFHEENTISKINDINKFHKENIKILEKEINCLMRPRILGSILAFELQNKNNSYKSQETEELRYWFLSEGFNIRPLGSTMYLMPPYCITKDELKRTYDILIKGCNLFSNNKI
ncbi:MAG: adenosylmethionine--8-amino-7-oxononanoate transaminase [Proteobacteria bacterium]|nr:adenosylmethionine--8-amino-7-oxononanoate transaminase [Pseudomonadota bacterium]